MESQIIFDKNVIEFVTVAAEYCGLMGRTSQMKRADFVGTVLKVLPLLYVKATLVPACERMGYFDPEQVVTEEEYEQVRVAVVNVLAEKDDYLEVFLPDMVYSDTPIKRSISEDLADIYQALKDFIGVFQLGLNQTMHDSLVICKEQFEEYWGQRLVNTMRALHDVKYGESAAGEEFNPAQDELIGEEEISDDDY